VKQFRNQGILLNNNTGSRVIAVTMSTNCFAGVQLSGGAENEIRDSVSSRNGNGSNPCGGI
jgi:hypothetical protein